MPNLFEVHYSIGADEHQKFVIAVDEQDCRDFLQVQEDAGDLEPGWTIFDEGVVEGTSGAFPAGPTQITKASDGRWDETA